MFFSGFCLLVQRTESIQKNAFVNTALTSITIPSSVTKLGATIFQDCKKLSTVTIQGDPDCDASPFGNAPALKEVHLSDDFTNIADLMFRSCSALTSVNFPKSLKRIGLNAFVDCSSLTIPVVLPEGLEDIGSGAFSNSAITSITIPKSVSTISSYAFSDCVNLTSVTLSKGMLRIEDSAFCRCRSLESVNIPDTVTYIGNSSFASCGLKSIALPDSLTTLGEYAFDDCTALAHVHMPQTMKEIGRCAFESCPLTMVIIPDGITALNYFTFMQTSYYNGAINGHAQTVYIPKSLRNIDIGAFSNALDLSNCVIYYGGTQEQWDSLMQTMGDGNFCLQKCQYVYCNASRADAEGYDFLNLF